MNKLDKNANKHSEVEREMTLEWSDHKGKVCGKCDIFTSKEKHSVLTGLQIVLQLSHALGIKF